MIAENRSVNLRKTYPGSSEKDDNKFGGLLFGHYLLVGVTLILIFIMFLVISRTLNNMINLLIKLEYTVQKEFELKQEALEVRRLMEEENQKEQELEQLKKG